jgi:hypothetical protein
VLVDVLATARASGDVSAMRDRAQVERFAHYVSGRPEHV